MKFLAGLRSEKHKGDPLFFPAFARDRGSRDYARGQMSPPPTQWAEI
jgi:hypothetical protein